MSIDNPNLMKSIVRTLEDDGRFATQEDVSAQITTVRREAESNRRFAAAYALAFGRR